MKNIDIPNRDDTPKSVFNPLRSDFTVVYRDDDNTPREYMIRSMEIGTFPTYIANHILKHLLTAVCDERHIGFTNLKAIEEVKEEIEVKI